MVFANPDQTFQQQADRVYALYQRIADVRDKHPYQDTDARNANLNNVMMAANSSVATLRLLHWAQQGGDGVLVKALGLAKPEYINPVAEDMLRSSRLFLLLESQFQFEALFRNILLSVNRPADKQGFYSVVRDVLAFANLSDQPRKLQMLNVPALMRNSMHANGIHHGWKGSDSVETIAGVEFRFEHGKRVQCGSWFHIVTALSASVDVVDELLSAHAVSSINTVPDLYSSQKAAAGG